MGRLRARNQHARRTPRLLQSVAALASVIIVVTSLAACGGSSSTGGPLTAEKAKANLEHAGYTADSVTNGANKAIGPNGKLNADVYLGVDQDPKGGRLYVGVYFFADPTARTAYATWARVDHVTGKKRDVQPIVEGEGVFTSAGESQDELNKVVAAARGG